MGAEIAVRFFKNKQKKSQAKTPSDQTQCILKLLSVSKQIEGLCILLTVLDGICCMLPLYTFK